MLFTDVIFLGTAGNVEHGDQYQLRLVYEHNLQRTACNMTYGPFGGVTGTLYIVCTILILPQDVFNINGNLRKTTRSGRGNSIYAPPSLPCVYYIAF